MKRIFRQRSLLIFFLSICCAGGVTSVRSQESQPYRRSLRPTPTSSSDASQSSQPQKEQPASEMNAAASQSALDTALTDSPKQLLVLTLWVVSLTDSTAKAEEGGKSAEKVANDRSKVDSNEEAQLLNLPAEFGSTSDVRKFINHLKGTGLVRSSRELRLTSLDGQAARVQFGTEKPYVTSVNMTNTGRTNSLIYRSIGTSVDVRPHIDTDKYIQIQLDYNTSGSKKANDIAIFESADGNSVFADFITIRRMKTTARLKSGTATLMLSDTISGSADQSSEGGAELMILGATIAPMSE